MGNEANAGDLTATRAAGGDAVRGTLSALLQEIARVPDASVGSSWDAVLAPGAVVAGRYQLVRELGRGGFGRVWEAWDREALRPVAFKALRISRRVAVPEDRVLREAAVVQRLTHRNIVTLHHADHSDQGPFVVMELLRGRTLAARLDEGPLAADEALRIAQELADGVACAHEHGVFHRDLKPVNVFICEDGGVKVLDFGLAHAFGTPRIGGGTPGYMAPEQWRGAPEDDRTDVFALGVILFRMLAGALPFATDAEEDDGLDAPTLEVAGAPRLGELVARMLDRDPVRRPRDAGEVAARLRAIRGDAGAAAGALGPVRVVPAPPRASPIGDARRRRATLLRAVGLAAVLAAAVGAATALVAPRLPDGGEPQLPPQRRLAVLPFGNDGGAQDEEAFSRGLREFVTTHLAQLEEFAGWTIVSPRGAEKATTLREARDALGATIVLEGVLHWRPDRVVVTAQLVDARTADPLTGRLFEVRRDQTTRLEQEWVTQLARMLEVKAPGDVARREGAPAGTRSPRAYEYYAQGRGYLQRYDRKENLGSALAAFDRALLADPGYALALAGKAEALLRKYEVTKDAAFLAEARGSAERALGLGERVAQVQLTMGLVHAAVGERDEAVRRFQRAVALEPRNADAVRELANGYDAAGRRDEAEKTYLRAIALQPDSWEAHTDAGIFYYTHGQLDAARRQFERVVDLTPDNYRAYANLGGTYFSMANHQDAARALQRSIALRPTDMAYGNLGTVYYYQRRYADAADAFQKAVEINGSDPRWWNDLADSHRWGGKPAEAAREYRQAIALEEKRLAVNRQDAQAWGELGMLLAAVGENAKALDALSSARRLAPEDGRVLFHAALVYEAAGLRDRALDAIRGALAAGYSREEIGRARPLEALRQDPRFRAVAGSGRGD